MHQDDLNQPFRLILARGSFWASSFGMNRSVWGKICLTWNEKLVIRQFRMTDPLKNQHVSQKETISKGNFLSQPSIFQKVCYFSDDLRAEKTKTPSDGVRLFV